jgi:hypothetical protein
LRLTMFVPDIAPPFVISEVFDFCNTLEPSLVSSRRVSGTKRFIPNQTKDPVRKTIVAPYECMMLATANRTKMFHVKHFGTIEPQNRTKNSARPALKSFV